MTRPRCVVAVTALLTSMLIAAPASAVPNTPAVTTTPAATAGRVVVDVADGNDPAGVAAQYGITPDQVYSEAIRGFSATVTPKQLASLRADATVEAVTNDAVVGRIEPGRSYTADARRKPGVGSYVPPGQFEQYVTPEIRRVRANVSRTADIDGIDDLRVDADIAILDSGIDPYHPDLNVVGGYDCVPGPRSDRGWADRGDGHGTVVAGHAAAIDNAIGVVGTAPGARLWAIRVADPFGNILDSSLLCGLDWLLRNANRIEVANMSFAGSGNLNLPCRGTAGMKRDRWGKRQLVDRIHQKICRATDKGITFVAAAGNDASDASAYTPAAYDEVITVSAMVDFDGKPGGLAPTPPECYPTDVDDTFAEFSNYGGVIDVAAPGVCNYSTGPGGIYGYVDGTSFAAPLVAGAAALLMAKNPSMTPAKVRSKIVATASPGPIPRDPDAYPEGVLNASTY